MSDASPEDAGAQMSSIVDLIEDSAAGKGIIRFLPDPEPVSIGTLWGDSMVAATTIRDRAGSTGAVGALLANTRDAVTGALGVWLSGNTLVSLPPRAPRQYLAAWLSHVRRMSELSGVKCILAEADQVAELSAAGFDAVCYEALRAGAPGVKAIHGSAPGSGGLIQFTSGSTSSPKGVVLSGRAIAENVLAIRETIELCDGDVGVSWLPLAHDMGLVGMLFTPLVATAPRFGAAGLVLMQPGYFLRDPARWLSACSQYRAAVTTVPNFAFDMAARVRDRHENLDLSSLRILITGAERIRAESLRKFTAAFEPSGLSELSLCPAYGMAENGLAVTMVPPSRQWRSQQIEGSESVSTGPPIPRVQVRISPASGGEIQISSPSLLDGYLGGEVPRTADGWFRTRDAGVMDRGELFVLGRTDDTIDVGGRNVFPEDIESAADHPELRPNSVAAIPWGHCQLAVVAEVKRPADPLGSVAEEMLRNVARTTGVVVSALFFVPRGSLIRTNSGKLQRKALAALLMAGEVDYVARFGKDS